MAHHNNVLPTHAPGGDDHADALLQHLHHLFAVRVHLLLFAATKQEGVGFHFRAAAAGGGCCSFLGNYLLEAVPAPAAVLFRAAQYVVVRCLFFITPDDGGL